jgi:hypothetical protein
MCSGTASAMNDMAIAGVERLTTQAAAHTTDGSKRVRRISEQYHGRQRDVVGRLCVTTVAGTSIIDHETDHICLCCSAVLLLDAAASIRSVLLNVRVNIICESLHRSGCTLHCIVKLCNRPLALMVYPKIVRYQIEHSVKLLCRPEV